MWAETVGIIIVLIWLAPVAIFGVCLALLFWFLVLEKSKHKKLILKIGGVAVCAVVSYNLLTPWFFHLQVLLGYNDQRKLAENCLRMEMGFSANWTPWKFVKLPVASGFQGLLLPNANSVDTRQAHEWFEGPRIPKVRRDEYHVIGLETSNYEGVIETETEQTNLYELLNSPFQNSEYYDSEANPSFLYAFVISVPDDKNYMDQFHKRLIDLNIYEEFDYIYSTETVSGTWRKFEAKRTMNSVLRTQFSVLTREVDNRKSLLFCDGSMGVLCRHFIQLNESFWIETTTHLAFNDISAVDDILSRFAMCVSVNNHIKD